MISCFVDENCVEFSIGHTMRCLTLEDARRVLAPSLGDDGKPRRNEPDMRGGRFYFGAESIGNLYWVVLRLLECVGPWEDAWLWLDNTDTWKRQGLHLYNRLRQSYGDLRMIQEAPVHQFHGYEEADLCSFIAVAVINEWSMYVITSHDYGRLFVSQSSGAEVWVHQENQSRLLTLAATLQEHGIDLAVEPVTGAMSQ